MTQRDRLLSNVSHLTDSIYGTDPQTFDLATEKEWSTLQCRPTNIRLGYRTEWSILGADPKTLD